MYAWWSAIFLLITCTTLSAFATEQPWQLHLLPASLHTDRTIHAVADHLQPINMMIQAKPPEPQATYRVELDIDLPFGMRVEHTAGRYQVARQSMRVRAGRIHITFVFNIRHRHLAGAPGSRLRSEWQNQHLFWFIPKTISPKEAYIRTTLRHEHVNVTEQWPLVIHTLPRLDVKPQFTRLALWDYGLRLAGKSAWPLGRFLAAAGINHIQTAGDAHAAFAQHGITSGGYVHHSLFANRHYPAVDVRGQPSLGAFADPQAVIDSGGEVIERGITALADQAGQQDGIATIDFEPSALQGFSPRAIRAFQQRYHVQNAEVEQLRQYMTVHQRQSHLVTQPAIQKQYAQWVQFRTWQSAQYMRIIAAGLKTHHPAYRLEVTTNSSYSDAYRTLSLGFNAAALAPYVDGILPQVYHGYGEGAAKLVMTVIGQWRQRTDTPLYPILLVQYPGARVRNSPRRLHQQIIGALAEGANGVFLYYPQVMDGQYWHQLALTAHDIALTEPFYQRGERVRGVLVDEHMPQSRVQVRLWPDDQVTVENPQWHYTVHRQGGRYLLTLFNLQTSGDLTFRFAGAESFRLLQARGLRSQRWVGESLALALSPQGVGFVTLQAR